MSCQLSTTNTAITCWFDLPPKPVIAICGNSSQCAWLQMLHVQFLLVSLSLAAFVQKNNYRSFDDLQGLWTFVREARNSPDVGLRNAWFEQRLSTFKNATVMPVPCAFNDVSIDADLRDHVGWVWYQRNVFLDKRDAEHRLILKFESVHYFAAAFWNGHYIGNHTSGHLPFEFEVTQFAKIGAQNTLTIAVNNTLSWSTIPQADFTYVSTNTKNTTKYGPISEYKNGFFKSTLNFDFFNYAGVLRTIFLEKVPKSYIKDIFITANHKGNLSWRVIISGQFTDVKITITDSSDKPIFKTNGALGVKLLKGIQPWYPRGMGEAVLYTLTAELIIGNDVLDEVSDEFGFRTVTWDADSMYINGKPFYCIGFGMHEDFEIHGRGYNQAVMTKDLNLFEWTGANCYRTSHYPYARERIKECDRRGIAVILESPAVGLKSFPQSNLKLHQKLVHDMVLRDFNRPSVIMWSLANEPHTEMQVSEQYFSKIAQVVRDLDTSRPITIVYGPSDYYNDKTAHLIDIICVNSYRGWYENMGYLSSINQSVVFEYMMWKETFNKLVLVTEYGADSIPGLNEEPSVDFSEQYQNDVIRETHKAFDALRRAKVIGGEMLWNFADFMTSMTALRAVGNHKGVFTRSRQAKQAAYTLRARYLSLLQQN